MAASRPIPAAPGPDYSVVSAAEVNTNTRAPGQVFMVATKDSHERRLYKLVARKGQTLPRVEVGGYTLPTELVKLVDDVWVDCLSAKLVRGSLLTRHDDGFVTLSTWFETEEKATQYGLDFQAGHFFDFPCPTARKETKPTSTSSRSTKDDHDYSELDALLGLL
jgi:hypothetical protein